MPSLHLRGISCLCILLTLVCSCWWLPATSSSLASHQHPASQRVVVPPPFPWLDPSLPVDLRVSTLIGNLSVTEKIGQISSDSPSIPRLLLPGYGWWSEASHGVAWAGRATVFPSPIALGATFNTQVMTEAGRVVAREARAKHNDYINKHQGNSDTFFGLDFYAPNINLFVYSHWGRGQETNGEDPILTSHLATAYVIGIQNYSLNSSYLSASATAKHFFVFNVAESDHIDVAVDDVDLYQTYLVAFHHLVSDANVHSVMCAYSEVNEYPACAHPLIQSVLRDQWAFNGFVVSDAGAIGGIVSSHHYTDSLVNASALAINAGVDLCLGPEFRDNMANALNQSLVEMTRIDQALTRLFTHRIHEGAWDPPALLPWVNYSLADVDTAASRAIARRAALESIVLLKNDGLLPLDVSALKRVAIVGPNANRSLALLGNYCGCLSGPFSDIDGSCKLITPYMGCADYLSTHGIQFTFDQGSPDLSTYNTSLFSSALTNVAAADVAIVVMGLGTCEVQNNQPPPNCLEAEGLDRSSLDLPLIQQLLITKLASVGTPIVLVLMNGSPITMSEFVLDPSISAIVELWYAGEEGGNALAAVLFGESPSGRLPVTFPLDESQVPDHLNMSMLAHPGKTYRYTSVVPLYSFGYGLSYTTFLYHPSSSHEIVTPNHLAPNETSMNLTVKIVVENAGMVDSDEVVQVYVSVLPFTNVSAQQSLPSLPRTELKQFTRIHIDAETSLPVTLTFPARDLLLMNDARKMVLLQGTYIVYVGGAAPGSRGEFVDGANQFPTTLPYRLPDACPQLARDWYAQFTQAADLSITNGLTLPISSSIAGGLLGMFTVC